MVQILILLLGPMMINTEFGIDDYCLIPATVIGGEL
jgi:hypothetical protein